MMVEAGGAEKAWAYYSDGAPKVTEEVIAEGLEASKTWIKESIDLQLELRDKAGSRPLMAFQAKRRIAAARGRHRAGRGTSAVYVLAIEENGSGIRSFEFGNQT